MDVNSFLGTATVTEGAANPAPLQGEDTGNKQSDPSPSATVVTREVSPSGITIEYESRPKRLYRVDGREVPSVTTVLGILDKPAVHWWSMCKGVQGVIDLFDIGALTTAYDWTVNKERLAVAMGEDAPFADEAAIVDLLKHYKLTINNRLDQAAGRGLNVHDALEAWTFTRELPNVREFPPEEAGYVQGLVNFLEDVRPEPIRSEVMVGSVKHGYAGRFDLVIRTEECEYTERCYPKRKDKRNLLSAGTFLVDAKTSKGCYPSHHLQLAAYELASRECGYPATNGRAILRLDAAGKYELVFSHATSDQFIAIRHAYTALEEAA